MSRILIASWVLICLSCIGITPTSNVPINIAEHIKFRNTTFDVYKVYTPDAIRMYWKNESGKRYANFNNLRQQLNTNDDSLIFATNGGMYTKNHSPQGLYIENGKTIQPLNTDTGHGNFYLKPNGVFLLDKTGAKVIETTKYTNHSSPTLFATQSGPMLLIDDNIHPAFNEGSKNLHIRNGVGIAADDAVVFAISNEPVNFYDFATLFKERYGCQNALYLDGFVSKCYLPELKRKDTGGNFGVMIGVIR